CVCPSAVGVDVGDKGFRGIRSGQIIHTDRRALPRQAPSDRSADATAASCHERYLIAPCSHASLQGDKLFADRQITVRGSRDYRNTMPSRGHNTLTNARKYRFDREPWL